MNRLTFPALLAAAMFLSGCVIYADGDDSDRVHARVSTHGETAYLMVPFDALDTHENEHLFHHGVLPALSQEHPVTNTGTPEAPWYCFAYDSAVDAEYGRRQIRAMEGGEALASQVLIDDSCAAG